MQKEHPLYAIIKRPHMSLISSLKKGIKQLKEASMELFNQMALKKKAGRKKSCSLYKLDCYCVVLSRGGKKRSVKSKEEEG